MAENFFLLDKYYDKSYNITGAIFKVSHNMGPGLLEAVYKKTLAYELKQRGFIVECEKKINVFYKGIDLGMQYYADIVVDDSIIIELKSVKSLDDAHRAQILNYLKLTNMEFGILVNFYPARAEIERYANTPKTE